MKDELITVIVPCYNVEKYISKCLDSIINQTYKNLEIILVDDSSTDNTLNIIKEYASKDERIKVIENDTNKGAAYSRNIALNQALGKYIGFIDSDDYIDLNFYELLLNNIKDNNSDIALCDIKIIYEKDNSIKLSKCYIDNEFNLINVINSGLVASSCNKLFKKEIFKYKYEEGKINEDIAVVIPMLVSNKISYVDNVYYYYIQRKKSVQNSELSDRKFDVFDEVKLTLNRISNIDNYNDIKDALIFNQLITLFMYNIINEKKRRKRYRYIKKYYDLIKEYDIDRNNSLNKHLSQIGKMHRKYYKILFNLLLHKRFLSCNFMISIHNMVSFFKRGANA